MRKRIPVITCIFAFILIALAAVPATAGLELSAGCGLGSAGMHTDCAGDNKSDFDAMTLGLTWQEQDVLLDLRLATGQLAEPLGGGDAFSCFSMAAGYRLLDRENFSIYAGATVFSYTFGGIACTGMDLGLMADWRLDVRLSLQAGAALVPLDGYMSYRGVTFNDPEIWRASALLSYRMTPACSVWLGYDGFQYQPADTRSGARCWCDPTSGLSASWHSFSLGVTFSIGAAGTPVPAAETAPGPAPAQTPPPPPEPEQRLQQLNDILKPVFFDFDQANIRPDQVKVLESNLKVLQDNPDLYIMVGGHADASGTSDYNAKLSQRRADAVRKWLIAHGIDPARISLCAYGEDYPYLAKTTDPGWESDRWVDIIVALDAPPTAEMGIRK